ncbi:MAG: hypothetical protein ABR551_05660 [Gemmatimonadales bacterium]
MATERKAWLLLVLVAAACGGGEVSQYDEAGNPLPGTPAADSAAAAAARPPRQVLADVDTVILREVFSYAGGNRDPFVSMLGTTVSGPELTDLELTGIYYMNDNPSQSVAVLRERVSNRRHSVRAGQRLGRLYVAEVGIQDVWFTIDDFGVTRREMLTLRKQEDDFR